MTMGFCNITKPSQALLNTSQKTEIIRRIYTLICSEGDWECRKTPPRLSEDFLHHAADPTHFNYFTRGAWAHARSSQCANKVFIWHPYSGGWSHSRSRSRLLTETLLWPQWSEILNSLINKIHPGWGVEAENSEILADIKAELRLEEHASYFSLLERWEAAFSTFLLHRTNLSSRGRVKLLTMHQAASYIILFSATAKGSNRAVRQEGNWVSIAAARIAARIITLEEAGLRQLLAAKDVPEISRIYDVKLKYICYQPGSSRSCTLGLLKARSRVGIMGIEVNEIVLW